MKYDTITLKDLKGLPGLTTARFVRSRTAALNAARAGKAATAAGPDGALNIWRDRPGSLHAEFLRHRVSLSHTDKLTLAGLDRWLRQYWPLLAKGRR